MIDFFIKRPIFATVIALLMVIAGGLAMTIMPVSQFPPITPPNKFPPNILNLRIILIFTI